MDPRCWWYLCFGGADSNSRYVDDPFADSSFSDLILYTPYSCNEVNLIFKNSSWNQPHYFPVTPVGLPEWSEQTTCSDHFLTIFQLTKPASQVRVLKEVSVYVCVVWIYTPTSEHVPLRSTAQFQVMFALVTHFISPPPFLSWTDH